MKALEGYRLNLDEGERKDLIAALHRFFRRGKNRKFFTSLWWFEDFDDPKKVTRQEMRSNLLFAVDRRPIRFRGKSSFFKNGELTIETTGKKYYIPVGVKNDAPLFRFCDGNDILIVTWTGGIDAAKPDDNLRRHQIVFLKEWWQGELGGVNGGMRP